MVALTKNLMGDIIHQGGQYSPVNNVQCPGGQYSLVNNVRGDNFWGDNIHYYNGTPGYPTPMTPL